MAYIEGEVPSVVQGGNYGGYGFGGDSAWVLIILFAMIFGGNGFGWGNGGATGLTGEGATLQRQLDSATNSLERKGDYIQEQLCDMNAQSITNTLNGFNGVNTNIMQTGYNITDAINTSNIANLQSANSIQSAIARNGYDMSLGFCSLNNALNTNTCAITTAMAQGFQGIKDQLYADKLEAKNELIDNLRSRNSSLELAASQYRQNQYLIQQLRPIPEPAYIVPNPFTGTTGDGTTTG